MKQIDVQAVHLATVLHRNDRKTLVDICTEFGNILLNPDLKDPHKGLKYSTFNLNFKFKESSDQVHADIKTVEFVFIYFFLSFLSYDINNSKVSIP